MSPEPLIAVRDLESSRHWYQTVLGLRSSASGVNDEKLLSGERVVMRMRSWDTRHHPHLGRPDVRARGNGMLLWFRTDDFDAAVLRVRQQAAQVLEGPELNPNVGQREIWLRDPDGYVVVLAGPEGEVAA
jgi:catechol 2,3-dioxygenase-like lactoylglutathione lyase family enzyme